MTREIRNEADDLLFDPLDEECIRGYEDTKIICMNVRHDYTRTLEGNEASAGRGNEGDGRVRDAGGWSIGNLFAQALFPNSRKAKAARGECDPLAIGAPSVSSGHPERGFTGWCFMAASLALSVALILTKKEVWYALIPSAFILNFIHINL